MLATSPLTYWAWKGHQIHYVKSGDNSSYPALLLIHGFGASTDHWRKNIAALSQKYEVWAIDLLGFGRSAKPSLNYGVDLWREQLHDFITQQIGRPTVLAGNSLGGYSAMTVAAAYPADCAGLILLNSAGAFTDTSPLGLTKLNPIQKGFQKLVQSIFKQSWGSRLIFEFVRQKRQIRKTLRRVYVNQSEVSDRLVEEIYRPSKDVGAAAVFASVFANQQGKKVDQLLTEISCPLLCIWGEHDPWINAKARSSKFKTFYPNLSEVFLNAGHCPHDDAPDLVNQAIADWLESKTKVST
jgi:pimeloyl-ACP methyl ester carboxylesterase